MRFIEPHIHCSSRTTDDYYNMAVSGIVACCEPSFWSGTDRSSVPSFEDYWEHITAHEPERASQYGIKHYAMIGLNPKEARNRLARDVLKSIDRFLRKPRVIGVGEIGLDLITKEEEEVFSAQLELAERHRMPVIVHSPHHNKRKGIERLIALIKNSRVPQNNIVMDHNTEETIDLTLSKTDCWAGMTVYYVTKLSAERAVAMMERYGTERMIVNGSADWGYSDPLAVPKVAMLMRKSGFSVEEIDKVTYQNPASLLSRSGRFDPGRL